jgi:hypothetical protein
MKFLILILIITEILLTGCFSTVGEIEIKGKVTDEKTKKEIPLRKIIVQGLIESRSRLVPIEAGQFTTDSSGYFSYSFQKVKDAYYYNFCLVGDSDYAYIIKEKTLYELQRDASYLSFSLCKLSDFTINILRKSKFPLRDTLMLYWDSDGVNGKTLYPYKIDNNVITPAFEFMWVGGAVRSTIRTKVFADKRTRVRWVLFRNGIMREITDTITCKRDVANNVYFTY